MTAARNARQPAYRMKLFGRGVRLSESARRNLYMAPGVALIFGTICADGCASRDNRVPIQVYQAGRQHPSSLVKIESAAPLLVEGETAFRVK